MNNTLIKFLHIKCTSIEIVRQIAWVLVMYKQMDESVGDWICYNSLSLRGHMWDAERQGKLTWEIEASEKREHREKGQEKGKVPSGFNKVGAPLLTQI